MKQAVTIILFVLTSAFVRANVYVIIYATRDGKTGHAGLAVDNYRIVSFDNHRDTLADGTLTYFDLWPERDHFGLRSLSMDCSAKYYQLPNAVWSSKITLSSLYEKGLPHRKRYPCDALLMIRTTATSDFGLKKNLEGVLSSNRMYNPRHYNCSDFVVESLQSILHKPIRAKEFMPFTLTTTPNKLCRKLMKQRKIVVIKSPGKKINGNFIQERIMKRKPVYNPFAS